MQKVRAWLNRQSESTLTGVTLLVVVGVGGVDFLSLQPVSFVPFYLLIVAAAAWLGGAKPGIFAALVGTTIMLQKDWRATLPSDYSWTIYWNGGVRLAVLLFTAGILAELKRLTQELEGRVKQRTAALEAVTDQHNRTEAQLRDNVQRFREVTENISEVFWMSDTEKRHIAYVSTGYEKIWGRTCESLYQSPRAWLDAIHPEDRDQVKQAALTKQAQGDYDEEYRVVRPDGSLRWIRDRAFPVRDESGAVCRIVGIAADITERKQTEMLLQEREARFRALFDNSSDGIVIAEPETRRFLYANRTFLRMLGYALEEIRTLSVESIHPADALPHVLDQFQKLLREEVKSVLNIPVKRKDGTVFLAEIGAFPLELRGKRQVAGVFRDVTERRRMQEALQLQERVLASMVESVQLVDDQGIIRYANPATDAMFGYERGELQGQPIRVLSGLSPDEFARRFAEITEWMKTHGSYFGEFRNRRKDGSEFITEAGISTMTFAGTNYSVAVRLDITSRKRAQAQLAMLGHGLASTSELICITDLEDRFTYVNRAFQQTYGYPEAEILGNTPRMLDSPNSPPGLRAEILAKSHLGGWQGEVLNQRKDGTEFPIFLSTSQIKDSSGQILGLLGVAQNITDRKRAESILKESEYKFRVLFEAAPIGIVLANADGGDLEANTSFRHLVGYTQRELAGLTVGAITHPEDLTKTVQALAELGDERRAQAVLEKRYRHKDGHFINAQVFARSIRSKGAASRRIICMVTDVTRRKVEERLMGELAAIVAQSEDAIASSTLDRKVLTWNRAAERIYGYSAAEMIGQSLSLLVPPDRAAEHEAVWRDVLEGRSVESLETVRRRKDGALIDVSLTVSPVRDATHRMTGTSVIAREISERKRMEHEILEISANERRRIGHDLHDGLGQYLAGIALRAKALEQMLAEVGSPHAGEVKEVATLVGSAIRQARTLARGLDPIGIEGESTLAGALQSLAAENMELFHLGCEFRWTGPEVRVAAPVANALYRIVQEAIHNAMEHGKVRHLQIEVAVDADNLCLRVQDHGTGFQPDRPRPGGMGLRVMNYRAKSIGASLHIRSEPGLGTELRCVVPRTAWVQPRGEDVGQH